MASAALTSARRGPDWPHWGRTPGHGRRLFGAAGPRLEGPLDRLFLLSAGFVAVTLVLGGASQGNAWQVAVLELFSLAVIGVGLPRLRARGGRSWLRFPAALFGLMLLIPLLQLIPLPYGLWADLPGRAELAEGLREAGASVASLPLSLAPHRTLDAMLWLLIPAAVFIAVCAASSHQRPLFLLLVVGASVASQLLGMLQLGGMDEALRFYEISNVQRPVGLFANRNHHGLLLLTALPLFAAWLRRRDDEAEWTAFAALAVLSAITLASILASHSRAGLALGAPAVIGAFVVLLRGRRIDRRVVLAACLVILALAAAGAAALLSSAGMMNRLATPLGADFRTAIWGGTVSLAERFSPFGSGIGSFQLVYPAIERPETLQFAFVNHAHNEYLEVWMEAGYAGVAVMLALAGWVVWAGLRCWRARGTSAVMGQGAGVAILLVALHSIVDYPARTPAIAAVLALALALLAVCGRNRGKTQIA